MNTVNLIGRLTKDIEVKYTGSQKAVAKFTLAVNGINETDFIRCEAWEKNAENLGKYCHKGSQIGIVGRLKSGEYEKDGVKVYTQDVIVQRVFFIGNKEEEREAPSQTTFEAINEKVPF